MEPSSSPASSRSLPVSGWPLPTGKYNNNNSQACQLTPYSWVNLLISRFALGFAVGAKSSTTPVYAAESAPKTIRGALTMMWQMWTAFGIMLGFVVSVAFQNTTVLGEGSQWRWMLASTSIPPLIVCLQVYFCPEVCSASDMFAVYCTKAPL